MKESAFMQVFENRQNTKFVQTMATVAAVQGSDEIDDIMQQLIDSLFPYREEERQEDIKEAMELFEQEKGRTIEIEEADYQ